MVHFKHQASLVTEGTHTNMHVTQELMVVRIGNKVTGLGTSQVSP